MRTRSAGEAVCAGEVSAAGAHDRGEYCPQGWIVSPGRIEVAAAPMVEGSHLFASRHAAKQTRGAAPGGSRVKRALEAGTAKTEESHVAAAYTTAPLRTRAA